MNFQSGGDRLRRNMSIKSSFHHLEKCARAAELSGALKRSAIASFEKAVRCSNFAPLVRATSRLSREFQQC